MFGLTETKRHHSRPRTRSPDAVAGVRPSGYRAPMWELNWTRKLLRDRGFLYDSSLMDTTPLRARGRRGGRWSRSPFNGHSTTGNSIAMCRTSPHGADRESGQGHRMCGSWSSTRSVRGRLLRVDQSPVPVRRPSRAMRGRPHRICVLHDDVGSPDRRIATHVRSLDLNPGRERPDPPFLDVRAETARRRCRNSAVTSRRSGDHLDERATLRGCPARREPPAQRRQDGSVPRSGCRSRQRGAHPALRRCACPVWRRRSEHGEVFAGTAVGMARVAIRISSAAIDVGLENASHAHHDEFRPVTDVQRLRQLVQRSNSSAKPRRRRPSAIRRGPKWYAPPQ